MGVVQDPCSYPDCKKLASGTAKCLFCIEGLNLKFCEDHSNHAIHSLADIYNDAEAVDVDNDETVEEETREWMLMFRKKQDFKVLKMPDGSERVFVYSHVNPLNLATAPGKGRIHLFNEIPFDRERYFPLYGYTQFQGVVFDNQFWWDGLPLYDNEMETVFGIVRVYVQTNCDNPLRWLFLYLVNAINPDVAFLRCPCKFQYNLFLSILPINYSDFLFL